MKLGGHPTWGRLLVVTHWKCTRLQTEDKMSQKSVFQLFFFFFNRRQKIIQAYHLKVFGISHFFHDSLRCAANFGVNRSLALNVNTSELARSMGIHGDPLSNFRSVFIATAMLLIQHVCRPVVLIMVWARVGWRVCWAKSNGSIRPAKP